MPLTTEQTQALDAIKAWTARTGVSFRLAVAIAFAETSLNVWAIGDNGTSFGAIQLHDVVHGNKGRDFWLGVSGLAHSLDEMAGRWTAAYKQLGPMPDVDAESSAVYFQAAWPQMQGCVPPTLAQCRTAITAADAALKEYEASVETFPPPPIIQVPGSLANTYPDRSGFAPEAIVLHIAQGSLTGCDSWFRNPAAQAGAHFGVGKDGTIHQYYRLDQAPYANGAIEDGYETGPAKALIDDNGRANPNWTTISIEHEGKSGDPVPLTQFAVSTQLCAWLFAETLLKGGATGVAVDRNHVLRHGDISPKSRPNCPGWSEEFHTRYIERVAALLSPPAPVPVPIPDPVPPIPGPDPRDARISALVNALTVQGRELDREIAAKTIQKANLESVIRGGT